MRTTSKVIIILLVMMLFVSGCGPISKLFGKSSSSSSDVIEDISTVDTRYKLYFLSDDGYSLRTVEHKFVSEKPEELMKEVISLLQNGVEDTDYQGLFPSGVEVISYGYHQEMRQMDVYFNDQYADLDKSQEILIRAAVVKTLTQFDGAIDYVQFFIEEEALTNANGSPMLMMGSEFVESTRADIKNLYEKNLKLYFASSDGSQLIEETVRVHYLNTASIEKVVVESLISGPQSKTSNPTLPPDTKLNYAYIENNICYVDFNARILQEFNDQKLRFNFYSVVNSLCKLDNVDAVQISVDGYIIEKSYDGVYLGEPLQYNGDLIFKRKDSKEVINETENIKE